MKKLTQYKLRFKRWRAETGSVEWHELTAQLRAISGNELGAAIHRVCATFKRAFKELCEQAESALQQLQKGG